MTVENKSPFIWPEDYPALRKAREPYWLGQYQESDMLSQYFPDYNPPVAVAREQDTTSLSFGIIDPEIEVKKQPYSQAELRVLFSNPDYLSGEFGYISSLSSHELKEGVKTLTRTIYAPHISSLIAEKYRSILETPLEERAVSDNTDKVELEEALHHIFPGVVSALAKQDFVAYKQEVKLLLLSIGRRMFAPRDGDGAIMNFIGRTASTFFGRISTLDLSSITGESKSSERVLVNFSYDQDSFDNLDPLSEKSVLNKKEFRDQVARSSYRMVERLKSRINNED